DDRDLGLRRVSGEVEGDQAGCRVEQHDVAHRTRLASEGLARDRRVVLAVSPDQVGDPGSGNTEVQRVEVVLVYVATRHLPDVAVAGRGQLVQPIVTAKHQGGRSPVAEHADEQWHRLEIGDADSGCF